MSFIPVFLAKLSLAISLKLGIDQLSKKGYMPRSTYISRALAALEEDDLDGAIHNYRLALKNKEPDDKTEMTREIISCALDNRIKKLEDKISALEEEKKAPFFSKKFWKRKLMGFEQDKIKRIDQEIAGHKKGIEVLENLQQQLNEPV